jgi:hypothetical protein
MEGTDFSTMYGQVQCPRPLEAPIDVCLEKSPNVSLKTTILDKGVTCHSHDSAKSVTCKKFGSWPPPKLNVSINIQWL